MRLLTLQRFSYLLRHWGKFKLLPPSGQRKMMLVTQTIVSISKQSYYLIYNKSTTKPDHSIRNWSGQPVGWPQQVDGIGSSELNFQQTKVNTWVDGNGSSELNFQQTKVNTWVDGYSCSECHSTSKPGCFIGTSVHQHIGTSTAVSISTSPHYHISTLIGCFRLGGRFALVHGYIHTLVH